MISIALAADAMLQSMQSQHVVALHKLMQQECEWLNPWMELMSLGVV